MMIKFLHKTPMMSELRWLKSTPFIKFALKPHIEKRLSCQESYQFSKFLTPNSNPPQDIIPAIQATLQNEEDKQWEEIKMLKLNNPFKFEHESQFQQVRMQIRCFVDRSLLLKSLFIDIEGVYVYLITHPRRSGKSVNLSMIKDFCQLQIDKNGDLNNLKQQVKSDLFLGNNSNKKTQGKEIQLAPLNIAKFCVQGEPLFEYFGKYPVIYLDLKMINGNTFKKVANSLKTILSNLYDDNLYLYKNLNKNQQKLFNKYIKKTINDDEIANGLLTISKYMYHQHNKKVIVLIDEYDKFINAELEKPKVNSELINEVATLISTMLNGVGKGCEYVDKLIIVGIFDILIKEGNSGLNAKRTLGISSLNIEGYFGLTEKEVYQQLEYMFDTQGEDKEKVNCLMKLIKAHYNGYCGFRSNYYNIWSVFSYLEYISESYQLKGVISKPISFWGPSGLSKTLLSMIQLQLNPKLRDKLLEISFGQYHSLDYNEQFVNILAAFPKSQLDQERQFSYLLLNSGYITRIESESKVFKVPNEELREYFDDILQKYMFEQLGGVPKLELREALFERNESKIQKALQTFLEESLSFKDIMTKKKKANNDKISKTKQSSQDKQNEIQGQVTTSLQSEQMYHILMLGLLYCVKDCYGIHSEQESGLGYSDIILAPKHSKNLHALIFELKLGKKLQPEEQDPQSKLQKKSEDALEQIQTQKYKSFLTKNGHKNYSYISIVFSEKQVCVKVVDNQFDE